MNLMSRIKDWLVSLIWRLRILYLRLRPMEHYDPPSPTVDSYYPKYPYLEVHRARGSQFDLYQVDMELYSEEAQLIASGSREAIEHVIGLYPSYRVVDLTWSHE